MVDDVVDNDNADADADTLVDADDNVEDEDD